VLSGNGRFVGGKEAITSGGSDAQTLSEVALHQCLETFATAKQQQLIARFLFEFRCGRRGVAP
jgi:hypothetical protein